MTINEFNEKIPKLEGSTVEFKQILGEGDKALRRLQTVNAFANTAGGDLYVGIKDENFEPIGLPLNVVDKQVQVFLREVKEHLTPAITYKIDYILLKKDLYIIKIHINRNNQTPVFLKFHNHADVFERIEATNSIASAETITKLVLDSLGVKYDNNTTNQVFNIDSFSYSVKVFKNKNNKEINQKIFSSLDFFDENNHLRQGAVLFLDNFKGNETLIKITKRKGIDKGESNYKLLYENNINILESIDESYEVIVENIGSYEKKLDFGRTTIYDFPLRSIFEGLVNAYAHKNYFIKDIPIEVDIFEDRLEIKSPGSLINNVNLFKETNISEISPSRRNEIIVNGLVAVKYMEKQGSGFDKISADYLEYGQNYKPYVTSTNNYFTLVLPNVNVVSGMINKNTTNFDIVYDDSLMLSERQKIILKFCYFSPKSINEIASFLNMKVSSYLRNDFLNRLVNMNVLKVNRDEKAALYFTNHDTVKILSIRKENI